jgi:hypothetical protein
MMGATGLALQRFSPHDGHVRLGCTCVWGPGAREHSHAKMNACDDIEACVQLRSTLMLCDRALTVWKFWVSFGRLQSGKKAVVGAICPCDGAAHEVQRDRTAYSRAYSMRNQRDI